MTTLKPGDILKDRYRIKRFISRGGMGSIYQACLLYTSDAADE